MASASQLDIGVLLFGEVQLLDLSAIDLFSMCSKAYLKACELPAPLINRGFDEVNISYIAEGANHVSPSDPGSDKSDAPANVSLMPTSASLNFQLTAGIADPEVAPGKLDILLIPGPDPSTNPTLAMAKYTRSHSKADSTDILVVCTSIFPVGYTGILLGKLLQVLAHWWT